MHGLDNQKLSPRVELTYAMLLKYAWQSDYRFPGRGNELFGERYRRQTSVIT